jgi:tricarballylate dehydrogenase
MTHVIVVGSGIAGLSAALSAAEAGAEVTIVERAVEGEHGGNTRYTEAYLRMKSVDEVADDFVDHLAANAGGYTDPSIEQEMVRDYDEWSPLARSQSMIDPELLSSFAENAGPTLRWLERSGMKFDFLPTAFITTTTTRLLPVGGGLAFVETLTAACRQAGVHFRFQTTARELLLRDGRIHGLVVRAEAVEQTISGDAVILACGGFEGNPEMLARYLGPKAINLRPVARGGHYNKGRASVWRLPSVPLQMEISAAITQSRSIHGRG